MKYVMSMLSQTGEESATYVAEDHSPGEHQAEHIQSTVEPLGLLYHVLFRHVIPKGGLWALS